MTSDERVGIRVRLQEAGLRRTAYTDDPNGVGDYSETWSHADGTVVTITWSPRTG